MEINLIEFKILRTFRYLKRGPWITVQKSKWTSVSPCFWLYSAGVHRPLMTVSVPLTNVSHRQLWKCYTFFNNVIKTYYFLPSLFWPISIMWAGSRRNRLLFSPPPEISLLCDGNSVGHSTCASHLIPLIHHGRPLRNKRISQSVTAAPQPFPVNGNKAKKKKTVFSQHWAMSSQQTGQNVMSEPNVCD